MRCYYLRSYVIGLECFMVSLQDLFYVCWGSKENQRRAVLRAQELHHRRDEASSLLRRRKLTRGTACGLRMARESKGPVWARVRQFSWKERRTSLLVEEKSANICSDAFCIRIEGINKEPLMPFCICHVLPWCTYRSVCNEKCERVMYGFPPKILLQ